MCFQAFSYFYPVSLSSYQLQAAADTMVMCLVLLLCFGDIQISDLGCRLAIVTEVLVAFLTSSLQMMVRYLKICNDHFLAYPYMFIICQSSYGLVLLIVRY
jgi:hypothetical protein